MGNHMDKSAELRGVQFLSLNLSKHKHSPILTLVKSQHQIDHMRWREDNGTAYSIKHANIDKQNPTKASTTSATCIVKIAHFWRQVIVKSLA